MTIALPETLIHPAPSAPIWSGLRLAARLRLNRRRRRQRRISAYFAFYGPRICADIGVRPDPQAFAHLEMLNR